MPKGFVVWGLSIGRDRVGKQRAYPINRRNVEPDDLGAAVHDVLNKANKYFGEGIDIIEISCRYTSEVHNAKPLENK